MTETKEASVSVKPTQIPWVEKHRPRSLADIAYQDEVVQILKSNISRDDLPHLLFYGPPGVGKTSSILAAANELYGAEFRNARILELNASNERGIAVIRNKVKKFAQAVVGSNKRKLPAFKLIILDEADSMTKDAQSALRRIMEVYSKVTRFCIICNYVSRIIDPIASRCAKFRFKPLTQEHMFDRLQYVATAEQLQFADGNSRRVFETLVEVSEGDLRKAITLLQAAAQLVGCSASNKLKHKDSQDSKLLVIGPEHVHEVAGSIPPSVVDGLVQLLATKSPFIVVEKAVRDVCACGYLMEQLLLQLQMALSRCTSLSDVNKAKVATRIAEADKKLLDGADGYLQLTDIMSVALS